MKPAILLLSILIVLSCSTNKPDTEQPPSDSTTSADTVEKATLAAVHQPEQEQYLEEESETEASLGPVPATLIRTLPLLTLPLNMEYSFGTPFVPDTEEAAPNGAMDMQNITLYGLLPDTSQVYAVLWSGTPADHPEYVQMENKQDMRPAKTEETILFVTTLDKSMTPIQTAQVRIWYALLESTGCKVIDSRTSTFESDWTYRSEYKAKRDCSSVGGVPTNFDETISGKIGADGVITETGVIRQGTEL